MAVEEVLTYLQDVLDAIYDIESCFVDFPTGQFWLSLRRWKKLRVNTISSRVPAICEKAVAQKAAV